VGTRLRRAARLLEQLESIAEPDRVERDVERRWQRCRFRGGECECADRAATAWL
jgi:hypothetical protein